MNRSLFTSWHGVIAFVVSAGFVAWFVYGGFSPGRVIEADGRWFLLMSGWAALALFLIVMAYVARKYIHKSGISPEFRRRVSMERLEQAETRLGEVRRQIRSGNLARVSHIQRECNSILRATKVHKVMKVEVVPAQAADDPPFVIHPVPTEPYGRMAGWLHAHLYYGLAAAIIVALHGGAFWHTLPGLLLGSLSYLVIITGIFGIVLWAYGPARMTRAERDLPIERTFALYESLQRKIDAAFELLDPKHIPLLTGLSSGSGTFADRAALARTKLESEELDRGERENILSLLGQHHRVKQELTAQWRIKRFLNLWRVVHIPAAVLLMFVVVLHVFAVLWY